MPMRPIPLLVAALLGAVAHGWIAFPDPPQPLPRFAPSYDMFESSIIMPCNYTGEFDSTVAARWGIADIDWSNGKAQWAQNHPMTSEENLVTAATAIRAISNRTSVWIYRNLVYAPAWFTEVQEKLISHPEWFILFKKEGPYDNAKCTLGKCSDLFHSQFQTMQYTCNETLTGESCEHAGRCTEAHCDCGDVPCGWYLWNHSHPDCREWLVKTHMMGEMSMGNKNVQGNFIDDEWFDDDRKSENGGVAGPSLEGPGSESAAHDTGMDGDAIRRMQNDWRKTMDAANAAVIAANGYTWRLFYNNGTCAQAPFVGGTNRSESECEEYMSIACGPEAPLENNALFYGFSGMTGCSPDSSSLSTRRMASTAGEQQQQQQSTQSTQSSLVDPIIDKIQHLASFLLIRGPYAWLGWAWLGCGNFPYRPPEMDVDYGTPLGTCYPVENQTGVFGREYTKSSVRVDCRNWEATITPKTTTPVGEFADTTVEV